MSFMRCRDEGLAEMAQELSTRRHIEAMASIADDEGRRTAAAYEVIATERRLERSYYQGMATLLEVEEGASAFRVVSSIGDAHG